MIDIDMNTWCLRPAEAVSTLRNRCRIGIDNIPHQVFPKQGIIAPKPSLWESRM